MRTSKLVRRMNLKRHGITVRSTCPITSLLHYRISLRSFPRNPLRRTISFPYVNGDDVMELDQEKSSSSLLRKE